MGVALSVVLFFFRCGIFFLEVVFFLRSQSLFLKRCFIFFSICSGLFFREPSKILVTFDLFFRCFVLSFRCFVFFLEVLLFFSASKKKYFRI